MGVYRGGGSSGLFFGPGAGPDLGDLSRQIALLQDELEGLREDTRELKKAQEFDQKLLASLRPGSSEATP
ncbi:MAG: hypothetical protein ABFS34_09560 [Gemmatimonadota bacterium]